MLVSQQREKRKSIPGNIAPFWSAGVVFPADGTRLDGALVLASKLRPTMPAPGGILRFPPPVSPSSWPESGCKPQLPVSSFSD